MSVKKRMVCVDCLEKLSAIIEQAKCHGWKVWVGGALCKDCGQREAAHEQMRKAMRSA